MDCEHLGFHVFAPSSSKYFTVNIRKNVASFSQGAARTQVICKVLTYQETLTMEIKMTFSTYDVWSRILLQGAFACALNEKQGVNLLLNFLVIHGQMVILFRLIIHKTLNLMRAREGIYSRVEFVDVIMRAHFIIVVVHFGRFHVWMWVVLVGQWLFVIVNREVGRVLYELIIAIPDWITVLWIVLDLWNHCFDTM